jgi:ankyrin repeat protein
MPATQPSDDNAALIGGIVGGVVALLLIVGCDCIHHEKLIDAINKNDTATASSLISSGSVNLNGKPWPLHHAARRGRVEIMTMLLDAGADINAVDERSTYCVSFRNSGTIILMRSNCLLSVVQISPSSIPMAAHCSRLSHNCRDERFAILLLDAGAPLDGLSNGELMRLVKSVAVFDRLMARGVNFTAMRDENGATLCHHVARNVTSEDDLRFLVNVCGNDAVHAVDNDGRTPLHWASSRAMIQQCEFWSSWVPRLTDKTTMGWTALINAAGNVQSSCVELLLALGADVDLVTNRW